MNQKLLNEDSLTKETGIHVQILDLSWIMDQTFNNNYEQLAIETLSIQTNWCRKVKVGANDYTKILKLKELENNINNKIDSKKILPYQFDWLLEVAILSKELEKPVIETRGLFERAINTSNKSGGFYKQFNAHSQYALAAYWWFEDIELFREQLPFCIDLAKKIGQSNQCGIVVTLLTLYESHFRNSQNNNFADYESRLAETKSILTDLANKDEMPSNAIMAKAYIEFLKLLSIDSPCQAKQIFSSLKSILKDGESLIGFHFNEIYESITTLDSSFGEL